MPEEQKEVSEFVDEQLAKGYIRLSKSEQTLPVFFVPKKDGWKRVVQDYRYLNEHTVWNNYPLPLISQLVDKLKGSQYFTKIDLRWGYNNVTVENPPIPFSPFSLADCTMLSHFSFKDFIAIAFPDLAGDLNAQI